MPSGSTVLTKEYYVTDELSKTFKTDYLCRDCKHSFVPLGDLILFPHRPAHAFKCRQGYKESQSYIDPVVGKSKSKAEYEDCAIMRIREDSCGVKAKMWAPKHKKDIFKFINKVHDE